MQLLAYMLDIIIGEEGLLLLTLVGGRGGGVCVCKKARKREREREYNDMQEMDRCDVALHHAQRGVGGLDIR